MAIWMWLAFVITGYSFLLSFSSFMGNEAQKSGVSMWWQWKHLGQCWAKGIVSCDSDLACKEVLLRGLFSLAPDLYFCALKVESLMNFSQYILMSCHGMLLVSLVMQGNNTELNIIYVTMIIYFWMEMLKPALYMCSAKSVVNENWQLDGSSFILAVWIFHVLAGLGTLVLSIGAKWA